MEGNIGLKESDFLIFNLSNQAYALPYHNLVQIIESPTATKLPNFNGNVRGTIDFLGETAVLFDLRKTIGVASMAEEITGVIQTLAGRKQDHINWLAKLKSEVDAGKDITVQTNPHLCAFGKWYDKFNSESVSLAKFMSRFDTPHKTIHQLASKAKELIQSGKADQAKEMIHEAENAEFANLLRLFDEAEAVIRTFTYEYAVVIERDDKKIAVSVDSVKSFERFDDICFEVPTILKRAGVDFVCGIGRRASGDATEDVLILDIERLLTMADRTHTAAA
jgi:chemotaxis signal transduction protein